jgi:stage V sporulation protein G
MASNGKKGSGNAAPTQNEQKKPTEQAEKKNDVVQSEAAQQLIPDISVRIDKLFSDDSKKLKAIASANIGPFAVHGIRVFENEKGMFVNMPSVSYKDGQGNTQYDDVFHPVTKEAREALVKNVIDEYNHALEQAQTKSQAPVQSGGSQTMTQM